jgi:hypothetical protein
MEIWGIEKIEYHIKNSWSSILIACYSKDGSLYKLYAPYIQFWSTMFDTVNKLCENHMYDNYNTTRINEAFINNFFANILLQLYWIFVQLPNWVKRRYKGATSVILH